MFRRPIVDFVRKLRSRDQSKTDQSGQTDKPVQKPRVWLPAFSFPAPAAASSASSETSKARISSFVRAVWFIVFILWFASGAGNKHAGGRKLVHRAPPPA